MSAAEPQVRIEIPEGVREFLEPTLARLSYLHPTIIFERHGGALVLRGAEAQMVPELRRDIFYALYREKIYVETLPMRQSLLRAVTAE